MNSYYLSDMGLVATFLFKMIAQPAKLQKKQCGGVYFCLYGTAFSMPIQQKLAPPVLLFSDIAGWVYCYFELSHTFEISSD